MRSYASKTRQRDHHRRLHTGDAADCVVQCHSIILYLERGEQPCRPCFLSQCVIITFVPFLRANTLSSFFSLFTSNPHISQPIESCARSIILEIPPACALYSASLQVSIPVCCKLAVIKHLQRQTSKNSRAIRTTQPHQNRHHEFESGQRAHRHQGEGKGHQRQAPALWNLLGYVLARHDELFLKGAAN